MDANNLLRTQSERNQLTLSNSCKNILHEIKGMNLITKIKYKKTFKLKIKYIRTRPNYEWLMYFADRQNQDAHSLKVREGKNKLQREKIKDDPVKIKKGNKRVGNLDKREYQVQAGNNNCSH